MSNGRRGSGEAGYNGQESHWEGGTNEEGAEEIRNKPWNTRTRDDWGKVDKLHTKHTSVSPANWRNGAVSGPSVT